MRDIELLEIEKKYFKNIDISRESPSKREYLIETYLRSGKLIAEAKTRYGSYYMMDDCVNTFLTAPKEQYIEIHHIIPLA